MKAEEAPQLENDNHDEGQSPFKLNESASLPFNHKQTAITKDSFTHPNTLQTNPEQLVKTPKKGRKYEPLPIFIFHLLIAFIISFQNIYIIYGAESAQSLLGVHLIIADLFIIVAFSCFNTLYMVDLKEMLLMYTLFDNILVAEIAAQIGLVGSLLITSSGTLQDHMLMAMVPISFFFFIGNFRVCIKYADWNRAQIITYKIAILLGAVCFFEIGAYFMAVGYSYTGNADEDLDNKIKDFITLYAFGTFEFFLQVFGKICDFDQTAELKWVYEFKEDDESEDGEEEFDGIQEEEDDQHYDGDDYMNQNPNDQQSNQELAGKGQNQNIFVGSGF